MLNTKHEYLSRRALLNWQISFWSWVNLGAMKLIASVFGNPLVNVSPRLSSVNDRRPALQGEIIFGDRENLHEGGVKTGDDLGII